MTREKKMIFCYAFNHQSFGLLVPYAKDVRTSDWQFFGNFRMPSWQMQRYYLSDRKLGKRKLSFSSSSVAKRNETNNKIEELLNFDY